MGGRISQRALAIAPSATLAVNNRATQMRAQGIDVVNFGVGEPDFDTPAHIKARAIEGIRNGVTKYTPSAGTAEVRRAIASKFRNENGLDYQPGQTIACVGAKQAIFLALQVLVDPGEEVIVPAPYWVSYPEMVKMCQGQTVAIPTSLEEDYKLTPAKLEAAITPRSKVLILNYPNNPTGGSYTRDELQALAKVAVARGLYIVSDEVYEHLIYDGAGHVSLAALGPEVYERTVTTNGVSKAYAMTGWRLGYAAGPQDIIGAMIRLQEHMNTNTSSITQHAAVEALTGPQDAVRAMVEEYRRRRDYMCRRLAAMPGLRLRVPPGAFYVFPDVTAVLGRSIGGRAVRTDMDLVEVILEQGHVAVVPGGGFGAPGNIRLSYATSMERITAGMDRMEALLRQAQ